MPAKKRVSHRKSAMSSNSVGSVVTGCGDTGETRLLSGLCVSKDDKRVTVLGALDELNAQLGLVSDLLKENSELNKTEQKKHLDFLHWVQDRIFTVASLIALEDSSSVIQKEKYPKLTRHDLRKLDTYIQLTEKRLKPLHHFIYPKGHVLISSTHIARAVCRRVERECVSLYQEEDVKLNPVIIPFANRLSDVLFTLARVFHQELGVPEDLWMGREK